MELNKWILAVELAEKNIFIQIEGLVNKFGNLINEKIAGDLKGLNTSLITLKKIYTIAVLEIEYNETIITKK